MNEIKRPATVRLRGEYTTILRRLFEPFRREMYPPSRFLLRSEVTMPDPKTARPKIKEHQQEIVRLRRHINALLKAVRREGWDVNEAGRLVVSYEVQHRLREEEGERRAKRRVNLLAMERDARIALLDMKPEKAAVYLRNLQARLDQIHNGGL